MNRFVFGLLCFLQWVLFARGSGENDYDEPNADSIDSIGENGDISLFSTSTSTSAPSDNKIKDDLDKFENFIEDHWRYAAIAAGVIVLCCVCACCHCCRKKKKQQVPVGQYSYYTQV